MLSTRTGLSHAGAARQAQGALEAQRGQDPTCTRWGTVGNTEHTLYGDSCTSSRTACLASSARCLCLLVTEAGI